MAQRALIPDLSHLPGDLLLDAVVDWLDDHPEFWDQTTWYSQTLEGAPLEPKEPDCGTKACLAGWIAVSTGFRPYSHTESGYNEVVVNVRPGERMTVRDYAATRIGLYVDGEDDDVMEMFSSDIETMEELREKVADAKTRIRDNAASGFVDPLADRGEV